MKDYPKGGLIGKTMALARSFSKMEIPDHAAYTCYFMVLSVFPALLLLLSALRYTELQAEDLMEFLEGVVPAALMPYAERLIGNTYDHASMAMVSVSAAAALWSSSRGIYGIVRGLNQIYGVQEDRGYLYTRGISVVYTFLLLIVLILTLVVHVFGRMILDGFVSGETADILSGVIDLRIFLLLGIQSLLFTAMYMVLPNRRNSFRGSLPGAVAASGGWLAFSDLYSMYVEHFSGYSGIYGPIYGVALSMLWLYFCISILFYGGALNRFLAERRK